MEDSTYLENRILRDYPHDIMELADILNIGKFGVMGVVSTIPLFWDMSMPKGSWTGNRDR